MTITGGFGMAMDLQRGSMRRWYMGRDGVKRWSDNDDPIDTPPRDDKRDAERYRWLRERDLDTIKQGGVFAGMTPANVVLNGPDLDAAIDAAMTYNNGIQGQAKPVPCNDGLGGNGGNGGE